MDDGTLINQFVAQRSHEAFAEVVRRYGGLVYSSARRQLGDAHLAEDVTQAVFITLAKKAASLPPGVVLSSWLLTATRYAAANARVVEARRRHHEARAAAMAAKLADNVSAAEDGWDEIAPALDEALAELPATHRDAVVLRYFGQKSVAEVAAALRITEDAAKQRVSRAVRQLRAALGARGVAVSPSGLAGALLAHATVAPPPVVVELSIAAARLSGAGAWTKLAGLVRTGVAKHLAASAALVAVVVVGVIALAMRTPHGGSDTRGGIVYDVAGSEQVSVVKDQSYLQVGRNAFWFDLYRPKAPAPAGGWPVVVLVHGGPVPLTSHPKDWPAFRGYGRVLGASGMAAVTFNYRFATQGDLPIAESDVKALLAHLSAHAKELNIDPQRLCVWAFSGGGTQLAAAVRERPNAVRCLVSFYGMLDAPAGQERYSPVAQLRATPAGEHLAPMLIARMGNDNPAINASVDAFVAEAQRRGEAVEVVDYPQGVHAFDIEQDTDASREVITKAIAFVKTHLADAGDK